MQTLPISSITVPPDRQRSFFDPIKLHELKESIKNEGLFHAIILSEENILVAGATRLRAISELYQTPGISLFYDGKEIPFGQVPFTYTHKTDEASLFRIELEENLRRENLSPLDEAQALARLHELLQGAAPELVPGTGLKADVTIKQTAEELGRISGDPRPSDQQRIADSIIVDKFKDHPDVKRAKSLPEAARVARKIMEREFREVLGRMQNTQPQESRHSIILGECSSILPQLDPGTVDVIIADPPYGVGADQFGEQSLIGHEYKDDEAAFIAVMGAIMGQANRICKPDAAMFVFMDILQFENVAKRFPKFLGTEGWYVWPTPLIWHKPNRGHAPQPKRGPSRRYEAILYAIRGNREVRKTGSDVLTFAVPDDRQHGAGKPVDLYKELLSWIVYPGDVVLDPCAGSGVVVPAANALDCRAIAIEKDAACIPLIQERIKKEKA